MIRSRLSQLKASLSFLRFSPQAEHSPSRWEMPGPPGSALAPSHAHTLTATRPEGRAPRCSTFSTPLQLAPPLPRFLTRRLALLRASLSGSAFSSSPAPSLPLLFPVAWVFLRVPFFLARWFGPWGSPRGRPQGALAARRPPLAQPSELERRSSRACGSRPS